MTIPTEYLGLSCRVQGVQLLLLVGGGVVAVAIFILAIHHNSSFQIGLRVFYFVFSMVLLYIALYFISYRACIEARHLEIRVFGLRWRLVAWQDILAVDVTSAFEVRLTLYGGRHLSIFAPAPLKSIMNDLLDDSKNEFNSR